MIIGYDFWADGIFYDSQSTPIITEDNDGVAFDNCNSFIGADNFTLKGGTFDELNITKDYSSIEQSTEKTEWTINNVLLAKFNNNLIAGTIGVNGYNIKQIELKKKKKDDTFWQTYFTIDYKDDINLYTIVDQFIESGEDYEYCICPIALDNNNKIVYGNNTIPKGIYISYDNAHLLDNTASFDLIYNIKMSEFANQISSNTIETLGSQYPYVVYGKNNYQKGRLECLLVSDESATGEIDIHSEKRLRQSIMDFLTNKQYKIIKNSDGTYMLIMITGTPTLIPDNNLIGIYQLSFEFTQIGDVNNVQSLANCNFKFDYYELKNGVLNKITKYLSNDSVDEYDDHTKGKLSAPTITLTGSTLSWGAVTNASGYVIYVNHQILALTSAVSFNIKKEMLDKNFQANTYNITVRSISDGISYSVSNESNNISYQFDGRVINLLNTKWAIKKDTPIKTILNATYYVQGTLKLFTNDVINGTLTASNNIRFSSSATYINIYPDNNLSNYVSHQPNYIYWYSYSSTSQRDALNLEFTGGTDLENTTLINWVYENFERIS